ncbi:MAG: hypothetical protein K6T51_02460 [Rubrobacteraceae bacterium]|nr:hypothetical protein [Rubrobacteraceae bacterium]MCL6437446.1 hypothetical protein [Rubrobacteraceae bacterium]
MNGTRNEWGETPPDAREIIFCVDGTDYRGYGFYFLFLHEADVMMLAAAGEVEGGRLKPAEARKVLEPYREVLAPLYTDEQRAVSDPDGRGWDEPDTFPTQEEFMAVPTGQSDLLA